MNLLQPGFDKRPIQPDIPSIHHQNRHIRWIQPDKRHHLAQHSSAGPRSQRRIEEKTKGPCLAISPLPKLDLTPLLDSHHTRTLRASSVKTTTRAQRAARTAFTDASLECRDINTLRQRNAIVLVGWILLFHWQSLVGTAVSPDEDGGANDLGAVGAFEGLC